jgi:hypothetical protein
MNDLCSDSLHSKKLVQCLSVGCKHHVDAAYYEEENIDEDVTFTSFAYGCPLYRAFKPFAEGTFAEHPIYDLEEAITLYDLH